ncbi:PEP-CTERM sorting domain-containing protein [Paludisphaera soli]|uniref:PEP-CTERM sorting domain-containing protein n=1 Tax=Paludisphaera soli TaxID=2712865 RepID=UPI0013EC5D7F|nr:PEP-CTERM sorting domain-containing protein [Paludisphaera soli]
MARFRTFAIPILIALGALGGPTACAEPVLYTFSGVGSGELGGASFTDSAYTFSVLADTDDIDEISFGADSSVILDMTATIEIAGLGLATITDPVFVFVNRANTAVGVGDYNAADYVNLTSPLLASYFLGTPFGPLTAPITYFNVSLLATDAGRLNLTSSGDGVFQASLRSVPEPASISALGLGVVGVLAFARTRRRQAA